MELIEREQQLRKLADAWGQVRAGKGRTVLVSGEAGIGKTSLIECFVAEQGRSARVLWGAYILIAVQLEERDLRRHFGDAYREYRRRTPGFIPMLKK